MNLTRYNINEIFYSLQGEGFHVGRPACFVRFSGCNLCCDFCDTDHRCKERLTADEIVGRLAAFPSRFAVLTGGEPGLQADEALIDRLHAEGFFVAIETNGTCPLPDGIDWITLSPKDGGEPCLTDADELKVVYVGQDVERYADSIKASHLFLQPCTSMVEGHIADNRDEVVRYCLSHPRWRLSLQTHRLLGIK